MHAANTATESRMFRTERWGLVWCARNLVSIDRTGATNSQQAKFPKTHSCHLSATRRTSDGYLGNEREYAVERRDSKRVTVRRSTHTRSHLLFIPACRETDSVGYRS